MTSDKMLEYYDWYYGWAKVPKDTYKADIALLAWLLAETRYLLGEVVMECGSAR